MRIAVVLNAGSGRGGGRKAAPRLRELFEAAGCTATVVVAHGGRRLRAAAEAAVRDGCEALVGGGGDGTISLVAGIALEAGLPFGVIPIGTLNHFARDVGIPLDLDSAAAVIIAGRLRAVDVAEVNGRTFLNNSSIGVYPRLVRLRERYQKRGMAKWIAAFWAMLAVLRRRPFLAVRVVADGEPLVRRTPFVLVANNAYRMAGFGAGERESLADGRLAVYTMNASGRRSLLWLAWQIFRGRTAEVKELETMEVTEVEIETRRHALQVALDGEVTDMRGVLRYGIRPAALRVFAPGEPAAPAG